jgi:stage II sporulation protein D
MVFTLILSFVTINNVHAQEIEPIIKVKLVNYLGNKTEVTLKPIGDYVTNDTSIVLKSDQTYLLKQVNGKLSLFKDGILLNSYDSFSAQPIQARSQLSINNRLYLGSFDFVVENNLYVRPVNSVYMEDYLKGVVPIEMYPSWNLEALKSQAVAARTYAMSYLKRGMINDTISYQVYGGYIWHPNTTKAVDDTKGQVLQYNGRLIDAVYSASNGGMTESNANAWGNIAVPYLTINQDQFDPKTPWKFTFNKSQIDLSDRDLTNSAEWWTSTKEADTAISYNIKMWLNNNGYANKDIKIVSIPTFSLHGIGDGGRISKGDITVNFFIKDIKDAEGKLQLQTVSFKDITAAKIRSIIGNRVMLSYLVDAINTETDVVSVNGYGDGHGVGMSQWGAKFMGDAGKTHNEILKFYYSGTTISQVYQVVNKALPIKTASIVDATAPIMNDVSAVYNETTKKTTFTYSINETANISVHVKNTNGKLIKTLQNQVKKTPGKYSLIWDPSTASNGNYVFVLSATDLSKNTSKKVVNFTFKKVLTGKVNASYAIIRQKATTSSKALGKVQRNQTVTVVSKTGSWYYVQYGNTKGYIYSKYVSNIN